MTLTREAPVLPEVVTPIKPSEALRLGRLTHPVRMTGSMTDGKDGACALGAIAFGLGVWPDLYGAMQVPGLRDDAECPACAKDPFGDGFVFPVYGLVYHLNDTHDYTDDQIVSWLEGRGL